MLVKLVIGLLATLLCIYLDTLLFEYFLNEASSTLLNAAGLVLFLIVMASYVFLMYRLLKTRNRYYKLPSSHD